MAHLPLSHFIKMLRNAGRKVTLGMACTMIFVALVVSPYPVLARAGEAASAIMTPDGGRYFGPLVDGKRQGKGRVEWSNGATYEGGFEDGLFSGTGRARSPRGDVYEGDFKQGLQFGKGRLTTIDGTVYVGEFSEGEINGEGRLDNGNGTVYEGGFKASLYHGRGRLIEPNSEYTGEFRVGEMSGKGELRFKDGRKYTGTFARGLFDGNGRMDYPSGVVYEGDFLAGEFAGHGMAYWPSGAKHTGQFLHWKPEGQGVFTDAGQNIYEGEFKAGVIAGIARLRSQDGSRYEGEFKDWMPSGHGELHRSNGDAYKGTFAYGQFQGEGVLTYAKPQPDGRTVDSGTWVYGRLKKTQDEEDKRARGNVEAALYSQPELLRKMLGELKPRAPHSINLYFLAIAGDGSQEVFRREVDYVRNQFDRNFATRGHSLALVNSRNTVTSSALASVTSIRQSIAALAAGMDKDRDILFLYVTSHGSKEGVISLGLPGMELPGLSTGELKSALKESGVRWKVLVLSSCYAGAFINELRDSNTMIITAARNDRRSFGCADENEFTYFGRAFFKEALPKATSFENAFDMAARLIGEWEDQDVQQHPSEKADDTEKNLERHSLPQMDASLAIRDYLRHWWAQFPRPLPESSASVRMSFAERVAVAKKHEEKQETQDYFNERMFPTIGQALADAMKKCTGEKGARVASFEVVANISSNGAFINIDHEPKTISAVCVAESVAALHVPPPPVDGNGFFPIVFEMSVRP